MNPKAPDRNSISTTLLTFFSLLLVTILTVTFYRTNMRETLEENLFDIRTRIKPQNITQDLIEVILIDDETIKHLENNSSEELSPEGMVTIIKAALKRAPKALGVLLPNHDFEYDNDTFLPVINLASEHSNIFLGVFGLDIERPAKREMSSFEKRTKIHQYGADTNREFNREIIRALPLSNFRGEHLRPSFVYFMASSLATPQTKNQLQELYDQKLSSYQDTVKSSFYFEEFIRPPTFKLNYDEPFTFKSHDAMTLINGQSKADLKDKIVLIGYTSFRKRLGNTKDSTFVNTPWQSRSNEINAETAVPLVYVQAVGLRNLLKERWLHEASPIWNILQTLLVCLVSFLIWQLTVTKAIISYISMTFLLLILHGFSFSYLNIFIPLSDSLLFSSLVMISGAYFRARKYSELRAIHEAENQNKKSIANIQARFLKYFSDEILNQNEKVKTNLARLAEKTKHIPNTMQRVYQKSLESSVELEEYMTSVSQFANIDNVSLQKVNKSNIHLPSLIKKIVNQFENRIAETNLKVKFNFDHENISSDEFFLEPILFNLVSNAVKYSRKGEEIDISVFKDSRKWVHISVQDSGPGIPEHLRKRIFEKFYRIKDDNVYKIKGTGLGLYLTKFFTEKIDGFILLDSEMNKGSKFTVVLPMK